MAINPKSWAEIFTAELTVSGEHIPLERVIVRHIGAFSELRRLGMTWRGISALLVRAGARRADGGLISPDQLRVSYARLNGKDAPSHGKRARSATPRQAQIDAPPLAAAVPPTLPPSGSSDLEARLSDPQDVSSTEIEAALSRLNKVAPNGVKK
jgi:hypothetical protein